MTTRIVTPDYSPSHCKNCGSGSHCGTSKYTTFKDYECDGGGYREVKTCDMCRCDKCIKKGEEDEQ
jgi:hypothetical protein